LDVGKGANCFLGGEERKVTPENYKTKGSVERRKTTEHWEGKKGEGEITKGLLSFFKRGKKFPSGGGFALTGSSKKVEGM